MSAWQVDHCFLLREFLTCLEYHHLMNTSQELFQLIRWKTITFIFGTNSTHKFLKDQDWQSTVVSKVANAEEHIELTLFIDRRISVSHFRRYLRLILDSPAILNYITASFVLGLMKMKYSQLKHNTTSGRLDQVLSISTYESTHAIKIDELSMIKEVHLQGNLSTANLQSLSFLKR
jgi:hypothetical protein